MKKFVSTMINSKIKNEINKLSIKFDIEKTTIYKIILNYSTINNFEKDYNDNLQVDQKENIALIQMWLKQKTYKTIRNKSNIRRYVNYCFERILKYNLHEIEGILKYL